MKFKTLLDLDIYTLIKMMIFMCSIPMILSRFDLEVLNFISGFSTSMSVVIMTVIYYKKKVG